MKSSDDCLIVLSRCHFRAHGSTQLGRASRKCCHAAGTLRLRFAACQHCIGQGEFCQRFTGIRLGRTPACGGFSTLTSLRAEFAACQHGISQVNTSLWRAFDVVHAEGDVAVEVTAGLDFAEPHARIAKGRGEEQVAQLVLQTDFKRGERIFGLIQNVQRQRNFGHFADGWRSMRMPATFTFRPGML